MRRLVVLPVVLSALAVTAPAAAGAAVAPPRAQLIKAPCGSGFPASARCGRARLPLDASRPHGPTTSVWFAHFPARGRSRGTVIPLGGGPGGALSTEVESLRSVHAATPREDLLAVDVRGTGRSGFLRCAALDGELLTGEAAVRANRRCAEQLGRRRDLYTTTATVLDIESIRRGLRLPAPRLIGFSYGTFLATAYLRRFGSGVRAAVLDGAFPAAGDRFSADVATGTTRVTRLVCGRTGACDPDAAVASIERLVAQVRARPLPLPGRRQELTESVLATVLPALLQDGGPTVLAAVAATADGAPEQLQRLAAAAIGPIPAGTRALSAALGIAVQCNDYDYAYDVRGPVAPRRAALRDALGALPDDVFAPFTRTAWAGVGNDHPSPCLAWPPTRTPSALRLPTGPLPRVPVLVLAGDVDLQTPIEGARRAARAFPRHVLVTVPGAGHVTVLQDACAARVAFAFLVRPVLPRAGVCQADAASGPSGAAGAAPEARSGRT